MFVIQKQKSRTEKKTTHFRVTLVGLRPTWKEKMGFAHLIIFGWGLCVRYNVTANWYFPMPLSLSGTSLWFYKYSFLIIIRIVEPINVLWLSLFFSLSFRPQMIRYLASANAARAYPWTNQTQMAWIERKGRGRLLYIGLLKAAGNWSRVSTMPSEIGISHFSSLLTSVLASSVGRFSLFLSK